MSFRKRSLTKPNIGAMRKKIETSPAVCEKDDKEKKAEESKGEGNLQPPKTPPEESSATKKLSKRIKPKVNLGKIASTRESAKEGEPEKLDTGQIAVIGKMKIDSELDETKCEDVPKNMDDTNAKCTKDHDLVTEKTETVDKTEPPKRLSKRLKVGPKLSSTRPNTGSSNGKAKQLETKNDFKDQKVLNLDSTEVSDVPKAQNDSNRIQETGKSTKISVGSIDTKSSSISDATSEKDTSSSTPSKANKSPSKAHNSPSKANDSPSKANKSPSKANDSPSKANDSPSKTNDSPSKATTSVTSNSQSSSGSSKLQKRKKVMPNLKIPKPKLTKTEQIDVDSIDNVKEPIEDIPVNEEDSAQRQTLVDDAPVQKSKRVHFETLNTVETSYKNSIELNNTENSTKGNGLSESSNEQLDKEPIKPSPSILKKDQYDYSSQSEGETSHSTSLGKGKKTFKPNLGVRRRKRLSSFSAYSSCDEEEDSKVKKKAKVLSESEGEESHKEKVKERKETKSEGTKKKKKRKSKKDLEENEELDDEDEDEIPFFKKKQRTVRKFCTEERDISTLTMQELIFYRPKSLRKAELRVNKNDDVEETAEILPDGAAADNIDQADGMKPTKKEDIGGEDEDMMAPQVMLDENGEVVINETSLTIRKAVDDSELKKSAVLYEDSMSTNTHRRRVSRVKRWRMDETLRFYKALSQIGTDFTLMSQVFTRFTRNELKKKFKQEEKVNCDLIDMALSNRLPLNMEIFLRGKEEREEEEKLKELLDQEIDSVENKAKKRKNSKNNAKGGTGKGRKKKGAKENDGDESSETEEGESSKSKTKGGEKGHKKKTAKEGEGFESADEESSIVDQKQNKKSINKGRKKTIKSDDTRTEDNASNKGPLLERDMPKCIVRVEKTKVVENVKTTDQKQNEENADQNELDNDNTDFQRTLKDVPETDLTDSGFEKSGKSGKSGKQKHKRLRVIDSDSE